MGSLLGSKIVQSRLWINPENPNPADPNLDYHFTYPITVFDAVLTDMTDRAISLNEVFEKVYSQIDSKQPKIPSGPINNVMMWSSIAGEIGKMMVTKIINQNVNLRSDEKLVTEKGIGAYGDTKAPNVLFQSHIADVEDGSESPHLSNQERIYFSSMTPLVLFEEHDEDYNRHLFPWEREFYGNKVDQEDFDDHKNNTNNPHRVSALQVNTYTREQIRSMVNDAAPKIFNYYNIYWDQASNEFGVEGFKEENWDPNYVFSYHYNMDYVKDPVLTLDDGSTITIDNLQILPEVSDPNQRYFAIVMAKPPAIDTKSAEIIIYFRDKMSIWREVARERIGNGVLFITYPDRRLFLQIGGVFVELVNSTGGPLPPNMLPLANQTQKGIATLGSDGGAARYGYKEDVGLSNVTNDKQVKTTDIQTIAPTLTSSDSQVTSAKALYAIFNDINTAITNKLGKNDKAVDSNKLNGKTEAELMTLVTTTTNGIMSSLDKVKLDGLDKSKLDGIAVGANNYTHPTNHPPSIINQDASNRFVSDTEKTNWNAKLQQSTLATALIALPNI